MATSVESTWEKMACQFPEETSEGFTVEDWEGFDVTIVEIPD